MLFKIDNIKTLKINDQDTGEEYYSIRVETNNVLTFGWIHSFEHIPWTEEYIITSDNKLMLKKITVAGFGAGIPHNKRKVTRMENGLIIMDDIDQEFSEINWIHSQTATEYIMLNGEIIFHGRDLPHHSSLNLRIEKRLKICLR